MNKQLGRLGIFLIVCYVGLFVKLNVLQVVQAKQLNNKPQNSRKPESQFNRPRGDIVTADGRLVAHSVATPTGSRFRYQRQYPADDLFAHTVGSFSLLFGSDGVERRYNDELIGTTPEFRVRGFMNPFVNEPNVGTVKLTLRSDVQQAAKDALGDRAGSVVALDPRTGAILAMWSFPSYNPNLIAANDPAVARASKEAYTNDPAKPLLAKPYRERYFPGSTFKIVTTAAGVGSGKVNETTPNYPPSKGYRAPLTTRVIRNFDGSTCGGALFALLRVSCNAGFAQMGAELLGPEIMVDQAQRFGFNSVPPIDLPGGASSVFPTDFGAKVRPGANPGDAAIYERTPLLAQNSIGQGDVSSTPLQMALVAAAAGNNGNLMAPHVLDEVRDRNGETVEKFADLLWRTPMTPATDDVVRRGMLEVVNAGTAKAMAISGLDVGGKTGTAQVGSTPPRSHAWVIGFAGPPGQPAQVAVAVVVLGQPGNSEQTGGAVAAPIARKVMLAALAASNPPAGPAPAPGG